MVESSAGGKVSCLSPCKASTAGLGGTGTRASLAQPWFSETTSHLHCPHQHLLGDISLPGGL